MEWPVRFPAEMSVGTISVPSHDPADAVVGYSFNTAASSLTAHASRPVGQPTGSDLQSGVRTRPHGGGARTGAYPRGRPRGAVPEDSIKSVGIRWAHPLNTRCPSVDERPEWHGSADELQLLGPAEFQGQPCLMSRLTFFGNSSKVMSSSPRT